MDTGKTQRSVGRLRMIFGSRREFNFWVALVQELQAPRLLDQDRKILM